MDEFRNDPIEAHNMNICQLVDRHTVRGEPQGRGC